MNPQLLSMLGDRWFALLLLGSALACGVGLLLLQQRRRTWSMPLLTTASGLLLAGLAGLWVPPVYGMILAIAAAAILLGKLLWLVLTGQWSAPVAIVAAAVLVAGLAGWGTLWAGETLQDLGRTLCQVEAVQPMWLWLLLLIPLVVGLSFRSLAGLGTFRRWAAIVLRCSLILFLTLALAEVRLRQGNELVTVLFLVDRSLSIPEETKDEDPLDPLTKRRPDRRWERIKTFINAMVENRGDAHKRDKAGLIVFGKRPRLELPPSDAPRFNFLEVASNLDVNYTDIGAAIQLGLASFPEGTSRRFILISDGNENLGNAEEQARIAKDIGVEIDIVPLAKGLRNETEVMVQSVEVPPLITQGSRFPIRVLVRSYNPLPVKGVLELFLIADGREEHVPPSPTEVVLRKGLNTISFPPPANRPPGSFTFKARFTPQFIIAADGAQKPAPVGRLQNKEASTHVLVAGQRRMLFVENVKDNPEEDEDRYVHKFLVDHLRGLGEAKFKIAHVRSSRLPKNKAELGVMLSNYDCIVLANVPADELTEDQQEMIRSSVEDQGCGLVMIGGPDSFGAGGWQGTPVEKALPVDCDIKALKVQGKGGLVLVMHACEMADGNSAQKNIAKLAINKLGPVDMLGVVGLGWQGQEWHVPFQVVGENRQQMLQKVDKMSPGDMPDFDTPLQMAYDKLSDPRHELAKKHIIVISDGDPQLTNQNLLARCRAEKITITTVGIATHGVAEDTRMMQIAAATGGRFHKVANPKLLPEIYTKEVRLVSQSFVYEKPFTPKLALIDGPTQGMQGVLNKLYGFVRTTPKPAIHVQLGILGPPQGDQIFPILATWHYGLGKAVAFTSDARSAPGRLTWDRDWADSPMYKRFWEQTVDWAMRAVESGKLVMTTEHKDGKVRVIVDARDKDNRPITDLKLMGGVTTPSSRPEDSGKTRLDRFEQKNSGVYEAEFKAEEAGSYFVTVQPFRTVKVKNRAGQEEEVKEGFDTVRGGVTIPYSQEFSDVESNVDLLQKLREITGGIEYDETKLEKLRVLAGSPGTKREFLGDAGALAGQVFRTGPASARSLQPIWFWLVLATGLLLFFDVAVRRIAVEPSEWYLAGVRIWHRLRGHGVPEAQTPQFLDRLKSKKAEISEELEKARAQARFEPKPDAPLTAPPPGADTARPVVPVPTRPTGPAPTLGPTGQQEPEDYASRLMRAKKRAMGDKDSK